MAGGQSFLRDRLYARRAAIANTWFVSIVNTSFTPRPLGEVRTRLDQLTAEVIDALLAEPLPRASAQAIGAALAELHYLSAQALEGSLRALGTELTSVLSDTELRRMQPPLVELLATIASGFYAAGRNAILEEQDAVRAALFVTRKQAEAADEARAIAEASARARSDLLGRVAHDLRSPLTTIKGQADLMERRLEREQPTPEWLRLRLSYVRAASERMQGMIGELLDAARLEIGEQLELDLTELDLEDLARRVIQRADSSGRTIRLQADAHPILANVDGPRVERVLENLLSNAIKYSSPPAPIDVSLACGPGCVTLVVTDTGCGIPAPELARVTTPFYRASTARGVPGTGLGLAGVKAIVEQHGGKLDIESTVNQGTRVMITFPTQRT